MASIDESGGGGHKGPGVKKQQRKSTLVDMTPLVDLGFLLITFFIFTTTMSEPSAMKLIVPKDTENKADQTEVKKDAVLNIVIGEKDKIFSYEGDDPKTMVASDYKKIRDVILIKKKITDPKFFVVLIKPSKESNYMHTVDVLDEMKINDVKTYALVDASPAEEEIIKTK